MLEQLPPAEDPFRAHVLPQSRRVHPVRSGWNAENETARSSGFATNQFREADQPSLARRRVRARFATILNSQVVTLDRPSKPPMPAQTSSHTSCTTFSPWA